MWSDLLLGVIHIKINYQGTASHPSSSLLCLAVTSQFLCKHWIIMIQPICSFRCVCMPFFLACPTPPPFFFFLYPFTHSLSAPVLGARPGFRQGSVCSQPWQPAMLLFLAACPTILETSQLFALLPYTAIPFQAGPSPKAQQTHPGRDTKRPKAARPTSCKKRWGCACMRGFEKKVATQPRWAASA